MRMKYGMRREVQKQCRLDANKYTAVRYMIWFWPVFRGTWCPEEGF